MSTTPSPQNKSSTATEPIFHTNPHEEELSWEVREDTDTQVEVEKEIRKEDSPEIEEAEKETENDSEHPQEDQESTEEDQKSDEEKTKRVRPSKTADKRISDITRKYRQTEAVLKQTYLKNDQVERENEELKRALIAIKQEKITAEENSIKYYMKNIENEHAAALEEGNSEKAAEATRRMAEYAARREEVIRQKNELENYSKAKRPVQSGQPSQAASPSDYDNTLSQVTETEEFKHNGKEWIKKNLWANPNSSNFNHKMSQEAESYLLNLVDQYTFEGKAEEIGSPEFFEEITEHVRETFNIPSKPKKLFTSPQSSNVAPVNRTNTVPNIQKTNKDIVLTPQQIQAAHAMAGIIKVNGQRVSDKRVLENIYKENLKSIMEQDRQMRRG